MTNKSLVACAIIRSIAVMGLCEGTAVPQIQSKVVVSAASPAPAGGIYQSFNSISLNGGGELAFLARLTGTSSTGIFAIDQSATSAVALAGSDFLFLGAPAITVNCDVLFSTDRGLFQRRGNGIAPVVFRVGRTNSTRCGVWHGSAGVLAIPGRRLSFRPSITRRISKRAISIETPSRGVG
jgi:hypothetical protein